jgi:peroxiredoxin
MWIRLSYIFWGLLLFYLNTNGQSQSIRIFGEAQDYSNFAIVFECYQNFINHEHQELFTIEIDENGKFDFSYPLKESVYAFTDLGQFRGFVYLEPGRTYELALPPFKPLNQAQALDPFYQPEQISLGIKNEDSKDLNPMIRDFDSAFNYQLNTNAIRLVSTHNKKLTSIIIDSLEQRFPGGTVYFRLHKHYSYGRLAMLASRNIEKDIISKYFSGRPVEFSMPAYWETFTDVFKGYDRELLTKPGFINSLNYKTITDTLKKNPLFNRQDLADAIFLYALYQSYHNQLFRPQKILDLIKEMGDNAATPQIQETAKAIYRRLNSLRAGTPAPKFKLFNFSGQERSLAGYEGKFVYLNFVHTDNYACQRDLKLMPKLYETFKKDLEIVTIIVNNDFDKAKQFLNDNKTMNWEFLFFGMQANILKNYNVQAVPLYFLINPEGKLVFSPAPAPGENFHDHFVEVYREYRRTQQRGQPEKKGSIFDR